MKYNKIIFVKYMFAMFLVINVFSLRAQETVTSIGGNATDTGGSISYTVGQVAYTTNTSLTGTITQGVQQPYEILIITGINEALGINLIISVYPNPTSDYLKLKFENYKLEDLSYQLFDVSGNLLQNVEIVGKETDIQTGKLLPATYFLKITDNHKEVKSFKIIKY